MATVSLGGRLEDKLEAVSAAGFDGIELFDEDLRTSSMTPEEVAGRCRDLGLSIDLYQPFRQAEGVTAAEFADVLTRFRRELEVMSRVGADAILVVSNVDADADAGRDRSAAQLAKLGDVAAEYGMTVQYEALAWGTHVSRVADAWDVVRRTAHDSVFLVVDTFHLLAHDEDSRVFASIPIERVGLLQVADAPRLSMDLMQWSRNHRCLPGEGEFDLRTPLVTLLKAGYRGPLSLEIFNPVFRELSPYVASARGAESLRMLLEELAPDWSESDDADPDPGPRASSA